MAERADSFWRFSLAFYGRAPVQAACLALQDRHGLDVNLLLYACWLGLEEGAALTAAERDAALARVESWRATAVLPLRAARRAIKAAGIADSAAAYEAAKAAELAAERVAQRLMAEAAPPRAPRAAADRRALAAANLALCLATAAGSEKTAAPLFAALTAEA